MLTLHADQVAQMSDLRFERRLVQVIGEADPSAPEALSSPEGLAMLRLQCQRARAVGMCTELDIGRYVATAWLMGPDFHMQFPAIAEVLASDQLTPTQKADAVERICSAVLIELRQGRA